MRDYTYYIDVDAIKPGDLANEIGDYRCAAKSYSKALSRLLKYPGDRMQPIMPGARLRTKLEEVKMKRDGRSILKFERWKLTKTSFVKGNQCLKYLYLDKHKKSEKTPPDKETRKLFEQGHNFEDLVREQEFPGGTDIKETVGNYAYFNSYTQYLLSEGVPKIIYEATVIEDEILVMFDVLTLDKEGQIDIYEIKLHSELSDVIIQDLSVQYLVAKLRFGNTLNSFNVIHHAEEGSKKWVIIDKKNELESMLPEVKKKVKLFKETLPGPEPDIEMGPHCYSPYNCEFIAYCEKQKLR